VLGTACKEAGMTNGSLWANVPHYISGIENPKATRALVQRVLTLINVQADLTDLDEAAKQFDQNLAEIVSQNAKIKSYVTKLESKASEEDEPATPPPSDLPPASQLVDEIEQFMRQQRPE
jgi:proteasome assembly chaperone (PAC2) family protein